MERKASPTSLSLSPRGFSSPSSIIPRTATSTTPLQRSPPARPSTRPISERDGSPRRKKSAAWVRFIASSVLDCALAYVLERNLFRKHPSIRSPSDNAHAADIRVSDVLYSVILSRIRFKSLADLLWYDLVSSSQHHMASAKAQQQQQQQQQHAANLIYSLLSNQTEMNVFLLFLVARVLLSSRPPPGNGSKHSNSPGKDATPAFGPHSPNSLLQDRIIVAGLGPPIPDLLDPEKAAFHPFDLFDMRFRRGMEIPTCLTIDEFCECVAPLLSSNGPAKAAIRASELHAFLWSQIQSRQPIDTVFLLSLLVRYLDETLKHVDQRLQSAFSLLHVAARTAFGLQKSQDEADRSPPGRQRRHGFEEEGLGQSHGDFKSSSSSSSNSSDVDIEDAQIHDEDDEEPQHLDENTAPPAPPEPQPAAAVLLGCDMDAVLETLSSALTSLRLIPATSSTAASAGHDTRLVHLLQETQSRKRAGAALLQKTFLLLGHFSEAMAKRLEAAVESVRTAVKEAQLTRVQRQRRDGSHGADSSISMDANNDSSGNGDGAKGGDDDDGDDDDDDDDDDSSDEHHAFDGHGAGGVHGSSSGTGESQEDALIRILQNAKYKADVVELVTETRAEFEIDQELGLVSPTTTTQVSAAANNTNSNSNNSGRKVSFES